MALITNSDKNKLFLQIKYEMGYPLRPFEIKDDKMLYSYLEVCVEDYSALLNAWLIQQQWVSLEGMANDDNTDFIAAFSTKSNHYMESFTYAYSKQVGLGANAPAADGWELKRDFITIIDNTQHYLIPADREVNEVLWETPPSIDMGMIDPTATNSFSPGAMGWSYMGRPAMFVQPTYSTLLAAQDRRTKQRILQSTLTYRITGLASGEKMLHLYPIPGSNHEIGDAFSKHYTGRKVWYWYYDTSTANRKKCLKDNKDIIKLPSDPPTKVLEWDKLNDVARQQIRNLLIAKVKIVVGGIRGFYSGSIGLEKELSMDYRHILDEGIKLKEETILEIKGQLEKLTQVSLTEERAKIAENVNNHLRFQPVRTPIIFI